MGKGSLQPGFSPLFLAPILSCSGSSSCSQEVVIRLSGDRPVLQKSRSPAADHVCPVHACPGGPQQLLWDAVLRPDLTPPGPEAPGSTEEGQETQQQDLSSLLWMVCMYNI